MLNWAAMNKLLAFVRGGLIDCLNDARWLLLTVRLWVANAEIRDAQQEQYYLENLQGYPCTVVYHRMVFWRKRAEKLRAELRSLQ
jgi:nitrate/nitrite-specific signal transduction histidine kinase